MARVWVSWNSSYVNPQPTAILVPSLWRPDRLDAVLKNIEATTPEEHSVYVVVDEADDASQRVAEAHAARLWTDDAGWYPPRLQFLYEQSSEPWLFIGQDDIVFSDNWLTGCFAHADDVAVVCPMDGHNPAGTGVLVERDYIDRLGGAIGYPGRLYATGYTHNFHDLEFILTATARGLLNRAPDVLVEHAHVDWGLAADDKTYQRVRPFWAQDQALFESRAHLWEGVKA